MGRSPPLPGSRRPGAGEWAYPRRLAAHCPRGRAGRESAAGVPRRLGERIGQAWLERPTVFTCRGPEDEQVPQAIDRLHRLATVRELYPGGPYLSERRISALRRGLPDVNVVPQANLALYRYDRDLIAHEPFAGEGLALVALLALGLLGSLAFFAWPLVRRRRPRPTAS